MLAFLRPSLYFVPAVVVLALGCSGPSHRHGDGESATNASSPEVGNPYPRYCVVMGGELDAKALSDPSLYADYNGKRYLFCCAHCKPAFEKAPEKWIASPAEPKEGGHHH